MELKCLLKIDVIRNLGNSLCMFNCNYPWNVVIHVDILEDMMNLYSFI